MTLWGFVVRSALRRPMRSLPALVALAAAVAAITVTYSIAAWAERNSRAGLVFAIRDAKAWLVPASGIAIDQDTGFFLTQGVLSQEIVDAARSAPGVKWDTVVAGKILLPSGSRYLITFGDLSSCQFAANNLSDARATEELLQRLQPATGSAPCRIQSDSTLPAMAIVGSAAEVRALLGVPSGASWMLLAKGSTQTVLEDGGFRPRFRLTSVPGSDVSSLPQFVPIDKSVSRFDPFSFKTKFASLMIHRTLSTLLGSFARVVFALSLFFAASNALAGLKSRQAEIGLLAAYGFNSEIVRVFLLDSLLVQGGGYVVGSFAGALVVRVVLPAGQGWTASYDGVAIAFTYLPILVVLSALIPTQIIANRRPISLVRAGE